VSELLSARDMECIPGVFFWGGGIPSPPKNLNPSPKWPRGLLQVLSECVNICRSSMTVFTSSYSTEKLAPDAIFQGHNALNLWPGNELQIYHGNTLLVHNKHRNYSSLSNQKGAN